MHSFRVSCVFRIVRVKRLFVSFAFSVRLRFMRIVNFYAPGSVLTSNRNRHGRETSSKSLFINFTLQLDYFGQANLMTLYSDYLP